MSRKTIPRATRQMLYEKYNCRCGYCGTKIKYKDMQIDHIDSVYLAERNGDEVDEGTDNYMPSCRQCNFYKSTFGIGKFRERLTSTLIEGLRKNFNYNLALKYGIVKEEISPVKFYFEKTEGERD